MEQEEKEESEARQKVETEAPIPHKDSPNAPTSTEGRGKRVSRIHVETAVPLGEQSSSGLSRQEDVTDKVVSLIKDVKGKSEASKHEVKLELRKKSGTVEAAKQADAPTRPKSAYMFFLAEFRKQFAKEHPGTPASQMATHAGAAWRSMTTEDKATYVRLSEQDKQRYAKQAKDFEALTKTGKVTRPRGPFLFFLEDYKRAYRTLSSETGQKMTVLTKLASQRWKQMTDEEKRPYVEKAKASKEEYRNLKSEMEEVVRLDEQVKPETSTRKSEISQHKSDDHSRSISREKLSEVEGRREAPENEPSGLKQLWQLLPELQESTRGSIIGKLPSTLPPLKIPRIQKEPTISPIFSSGISSGSTESAGGLQLPEGGGLSTEGLRKHLNQQLEDLIKTINSQTQKDTSPALPKAMTLQRPPEKQALPSTHLGSTEQISTLQLLVDMEHCKKIIESLSGEQQHPSQPFIKGTLVTAPMAQGSSKEIQTQLHAATDPTIRHMEARPEDMLLSEPLQTTVSIAQGSQALRTESEIFRGQPLELHTHKAKPRQKKRPGSSKSVKPANSSSD